MKHTGSRSQLTLASLPRLLLILSVVAMLGIALTACDNPFDDSDTQATPVPDDVTGDVPQQPSVDDEPDEAKVEEQEDGWTVITGRERSSTPEARSSNQVFRMAGPSDAPTTIDPALVRDTSSSFLARQVFRGLVRLNSDMEPTPDLARQVEVSPDGQLYRFELHEDITFHDGSAINAERVKASIERAADPALTGGDGDSLPSRNYLDDIEGATERMDGERDDIPGIVVIDELTLEISLERGVVDFMERMSNTSTLIVDVEQAASGEDWWQEPNGSGPFRLIEWDPDRQVTLGAHDGYVVPPVLEQVEIRVGAEAVGQMQLYETEQIDYVQVPLSVLDRVQYEDSPIPGTLREQPLLSTSFVLINPNDPPFDGQEFRAAIAHSIPRDELSGIMLEGRVPTAEGVIPPEMIDVEIEPFPYSHDPGQARSAYESVSLPEGFDQMAVYSSGGSIPVMMKHFIEQDLNLPVEVVQLRWADYMADMEDGRLPIFVLSWVADGPDPVSFLRALFHSESPDNYGRFSDPEVDALLDQAAVEADDGERTRLLMEAQQQILESAVVIPLYHGVDHLLVADEVQGLETTPMGILGLESVRIEQ
jgi:oligopeptide transport system substrate-binding protein